MTGSSALASAADLARFVAASLAVTLGLRVAWAAWNAQPTKPGPPAPASAPAASVRPSAAPSARPTPSAGRTLRVHVTVDAGPERSEVIIDGAPRGQVPFVGEIVCTAGAPLTIEVVPKTGAKLSFPRTCDRGILQIR